MNNLLSASDIEKISYEILKSSKSLGIFPTPVDKIVAYSELIVREDVDISKIDPDYLSKASDTLQRAMFKVRGLLDRRHKEIFLDLSQLTERKSFVKLHEVGHEVLPWQTGIHEILGDDDQSLSEDANQEFEDEANYFASITLFQHDLFVYELKKYDLSIEAAMQLARTFGSSIHAALRRYVECSEKRCALIVLENIAPRGQFVKCDLRNKFQSKKFTQTFGQIVIPETLGYKWDFVKDYYFEKKMRKNCAITLSTENGEADFTYQFFNNGYNAFVFIVPIGEKVTARKKVILVSDNSD